MKRRRAMLTVAAACGVATLVWLLLWDTLFSQREATDNAYVSGYQVQIVPQVAGTVVAVRAEDTQSVNEGDVLVQLDPSDATLAQDHARAELEQAVRRVRQLQHTVRMNDAAVHARRLEWAQAQEDLNRQLPLQNTGAVAPQSLSHGLRQVALTRAALTLAQAQAAASRDVVDCVDLSDHPDIQAARAAYIEAWLGMHRTRVLAPVSGTVVQRTVQPGYRVQPGIALMRVIPSDQLWVDANFKEVQLRNLRIGQAATIEVDLYGASAAYRGRVAGVSPGTGAAFALLPPQNASGNWVKVVQRVSVRIELDRGDMSRYPLLLGLSAHVSVDTHDRSGARLLQTREVPGDTSPRILDMAAGQAEADRLIAEILRRTERASL